MNMDETGWREDNGRAWLWTAVVEGMSLFHIEPRRSGDVVEKLLGEDFSGVVGTSLLSRVTAPGSPHMLSPPRPDREQSRNREKARMAQRYETIRSLSSKGMNKSAIARALGLDRKTVMKYLRTDSVPERSRQRRKSGTLAPYEGYILERFRQGCLNSMGLWREIVALGYSGSYQTVIVIPDNLHTISRPRRLWCRQEETVFVFS